MEKHIELLLSQIPETGEQIISLGLYGGWLGVIISSLILLISLVLIKIRDDNAEDDMRGVLGGFGSIMSSIAIIGFSSELVGIYIAPNVYMLEQISRLIK